MVFTQEHQLAQKDLKVKSNLNVTYVGYKLSMSPYGIQFSDDDDKLTMETLEKHDFEQGDRFVLYTDTEGKICLKKERDRCRMPSY